LKTDIAIRDQLLQGPKVSYGGTAAFNAGVGEKARADARIILEGIKNSTTQTRTSTSNYVVWQTTVNTCTKTENGRASVHHLCEQQG